MVSAFKYHFIRNVVLLAFAALVNSQCILHKLILQPLVRIQSLLFHQLSERAKNWGPNDTIVVDAIWYQGELLPYKELEMAWVSNLAT